MIWAHVLLDSTPDIDHYLKMAFLCFNHISLAVFLVMIFFWVADLLFYFFLSFTCFCKRHIFVGIWIWPPPLPPFFSCWLQSSRSSAAYPPHPSLPLSAGGQLRYPSSNSQFRCDRTSVSMRLPLCPPLISSSQPSADVLPLPNASGSLSLIASPPLPVPVPSMGDSLPDVIDLLSSTEPHQTSVAISASVPVPSPPSLFSCSPVALTILRCHYSISTPFETSVYDWELSPGLEIHSDDPYQEVIAAETTHI